MKKAYTLQLKKLGKRIRKIRLSQKMTQETLADLCDVDVRTIQRVEKGETGVGIQIVFALADALKIGVIELFEGE